MSSKTITKPRMLCKVKAGPGVRAIKARRKIHGAVEFEPAGIFTQPSKIVQQELIPGTM